MKVAISQCPNCSADLAIVRLKDDSFYIKCRSLCSVDDIMKAVHKELKPRRQRRLIDIVGENTYLAAIRYARQIGKKLSTEDKDIEARAFKRLRLIGGQQ